MLKNEFIELDPFTSIVVTYQEQARIGVYQATVRYITTSKCLTINTISALEYRVKELADRIVEEMKLEYEQHKKG